MIDPATPPPHDTGPPYSDNEYPSPQKSNSMATEGSFSSSEYKKSAKEDSTTPQSDDENEVAYINVGINPLQHESFAKLDEEDTELWLIRVPRHQPVKNNLYGGEVELADGEEHKHSAVGRVAGVCMRGYVYRDHGPVDENGPRAGFVTKGEDGKTRVRVGKPFSKLVSVTFDLPLKSLSEVEPLPRRYPKMPVKQKLRYRPIGSGRDDIPDVNVLVPEVLSQTAPTQETNASNGHRRVTVGVGDTDDLDDELNRELSKGMVVEEKKVSTGKEQEDEDKAAKKEEEKEAMDVEPVQTQEELNAKEEGVLTQEAASPSRKSKSSKKKKHSKKEKKRLSSENNPSSQKKKKKKRKIKQEESQE